jgi:hypothetical protein
MPATMSIVILVPDMMVRLKKPLRHPSRMFTARGVEIIATGSVTQIDQEKRDEENRNVDGCHDELDGIHVSIISFQYHEISLLLLCLL